MTEFWSAETLARIEVARGRIRGLREVAGQALPREVTSTGARGLADHRLGDAGTDGGTADADPRAPRDRRGRGRAVPAPMGAPDAVSAMEAQTHRSSR